MELTVYVLFSTWCYLLFYITYAKRTELGPYDVVLIKLLMGIMFVALGLFSLKIEIDLPNGSNASFTPISEDVLSNMWQQGLVMMYIMFGFLQMVYAGMDGLTLARMPKKDDLED
jgi:hypothetical protein